MYDPIKVGRLEEHPWRVAGANERQWIGDVLDDMAADNNVAGDRIVVVSPHKTLVRARIGRVVASAFVFVGESQEEITLPATDFNNPLAIQCEVPDDAVQVRAEPRRGGLCVVVLPVVRKQCLVELAVEREPAFTEDKGKIAPYYHLRRQPRITNDILVDGYTATFVKRFYVGRVTYGTSGNL